MVFMRRLRPAGAVCLLVACPCESSRVDWLKSRAPQVPVTLGYAEGNLTVAEAAALDDICTANAREHLKVTNHPADRALVTVTIKLS